MKNIIQNVAALSVIVGFAGLLGVGIFYPYIAPNEEITFTPTQTYTRHINGSDKLRVDIILDSGMPETLEVADTPIMFKFDSANDFHTLNLAVKDNKTCTAEVYGHRNPVLSMFRIVKSVYCY